MNPAPSIYEKVGGPYGQWTIRPDILEDVKSIRDTADALHNKFKPIIDKVGKAATSFTYVDNSWNWGTGHTVHHHHGGAHGAHHAPHAHEEEKKDDNLGLRIFAGIALTIVGLVLAYKLGETGCEINTAAEGTSVVQGLRDKINACKESHLKADNNIHTFDVFAGQAEEMFNNLNNYYRDRDLIPRIAMLAGVCLGLGACLLNSGALAVAGVVFGVGSAGWMMFNSTFYANEYKKQEQALNDIIHNAEILLTYTSVTPSYNPDSVM